MDPSEFEEELSGRFGWRLGETEQSTSRLWITPEPEIFEELIEVLFEENGARLATISCVDEDSQFELLYHFALDPEGFMTTIKLAVDKSSNPATESLANKIPGAEWIEREISEMFGVEFKNHPAKKRLLKADSLGDTDYPFRKDFDEDKLEEG